MCFEVLPVSPMKQLSLFNFPDEPSPGTLMTREPHEWWLAFLHDPRAGWEDREEAEPIPRNGAAPKQERIPGLT